MKYLSIAFDITSVTKKVSSSIHKFWMAFLNYIFACNKWGIFLLHTIQVSCFLTIFCNCCCNPCISSSCLLITKRSSSMAAGGIWLWDKDIHIECSKQFKWNLYFSASGQTGGTLLTQKIFDAQNFNAGILTHGLLSLDGIWRRGTMGDF